MLEIYLFKALYNNLKMFQHPFDYQKKPQKNNQTQAKQKIILKYW